MQKEILKQRDLPALITAYQQAYWQASSIAARNAIARKLWDLRREARLKQRLLQRNCHEALVAQAPERSKPQPGRERC